MWRGFYSSGMIATLVVTLVCCRSQEPADTTTSPAVDETTPVSVVKGGIDFDTSAGGAGHGTGTKPEVPSDRVPTRLLFTSYPETFTLARSGHITFDATEGEGKEAVSYECAWDGGTFSDCESPFAFSVSGPGGHSLRVQMKGSDGSVASEGSRSFIVGPNLLRHTAVTTFLTNNSLQVRELSEAVDGTIYLATSKGLVVYAKDAVSPVLRPVVQGISPLNNLFAMARDGAGRIFVGTGAGYAFTSDRGLTWTVRGVADGLPHSTVTTIQYDARTSKTYIGTYGGVVATTDGQTLQTVTLAGGPATGIAQLYIYSDGRTIVSNTASRLFVADTISGPFTQVPGMTSSSTFKVGPTSDVYIYGAAGIFISADRGASFGLTARTTANGLPANDVRGIGVTRDGVIYASSTGGLAASYDEGTTFVPVAVPSSMLVSSFFRHLAVGRDGRLFFVGNDFAAYSQESLEPVQNNSDAAGPDVLDRALVQTSVGRAGGGVSWNLAEDDVSAARDVAYLLFKSNSGALGHIGEVFSTASLADPRRFGVRNASIALSSGTSTYIYLVAMDEAGNALLYQPLQMTATSAAAQSLSFTQVTADAGLGAPIDHAVVAKGPWVYHIGGVSLVGGVSILNQVALSADQSTWSTVSQSNSQAAERYGHTATLFNNQIVVIGGVHFDTQPHNDVVATGLGSTWTTLTSNAAFPPRQDHAAIVYNGRLWVIGGKGAVNGTATDFNDVWSSADGTTWQQEIAAAPFSPRAGHTALAYAGKMWVIGGPDVWYSEDGRAWYQAAAKLPMGGFSDGATVVYQGRMWILGGHDGSGYLGVWSSTDGSYWEEANTNSTFPGREWHAAVVASDGKIYFYNGNKYGYQTDVWKGE